MTIQFEFSKEDPLKVKTDILAIGCRKKPGDQKKPGMLLKNDGGIALDKILGGLLSSIINEEVFAGEMDTHKIIYTDGKSGAKKVLLIGLGGEKECSRDILRKIGAKIVRISNDLKAKTAVLCIEPQEIQRLTPAERSQALAEGIILGGYRFDQCKGEKSKSQNDKPTLKNIKILFKGNSKPLESAVSLGTTIAGSVIFARDLVNTPSDVMTPEALAREAQKLSKEKHLSCTILDERRLKEEKMNLLLAVSQGSAHPPRLIHIRYTPPKKPKAKVALVGKGVTFDTGGYNLKINKGMSNMKDDMSGAAAVLATMKLVSHFKPAVAVDAYIPSTENMIDGLSQVPGTVVTSRSGKTVEIGNTDAEGRLILADAINYALDKKPEIIIELSTLTGGVFYALGELYTAILGNDQKLIDQIIAASKEGGELTWQLPLEKEYLKGFKESIADLNNEGKTFASTIAGGLFLGEFMGETKWAHMDIAASAFYTEDRNYRPKGGTGTGVQTLIRFLAKY